METTETTEKDSTEQTATVTKSQDYREFYFNHAQVGYTAFDIYAYLGNMRFSHEHKPLLSHEARIVMSPVEAKLFHRFLGSAIEQFEKSFLEIVIPKDAE